MKQDKKTFAETKKTLNRGTGFKRCVQPTAYD